MSEYFYNSGTESLSKHVLTVEKKLQVKSIDLTT